MQSLIYRLAAPAALALALSGCNSTTDPGTGTPPVIAGSYQGAVVLVATPGAVTGDTLETSLGLLQSGATAGGTWSISGLGVVDSISGRIEEAAVARVGTTSTGTYHLTGRLRVARADCDGVFQVDLEAVPISGGRWSLQGTFSGSAACFRGGGAQQGELTLVQGGAGAPNGVARVALAVRRR
jgi:hypothetical protein